METLLRGELWEALRARQRRASQAGRPVTLCTV